jgi:lipopolysaccharide/colanic/teichoic acid biosynthesis glycosyltransferase
VLCAFSPLWLLSALAIKLTSRGAILFSQERVGKNGRVFTMFKFRSMYSDAEEKTGPVWVRGMDPRVTPAGRVLRALHLDEVPQCINFLRGDMSLVGPRPERPYFVEQFRADIPFYMRRFNVKPGLLGWAQSKHEFDLNSSDLVSIVRDRLKYDLYYIENMSLSLDFKIMLQTIWFVLAGKSTR